jgi:hypothetical protein
LFHRARKIPMDPTEVQSLTDAKARSDNHWQNALSHADEANVEVSRQWHIRERNHIGPAFAAMYERSRRQWT